MWAYLERTAKSALLVFLLAAASTAQATSLDYGPADHPVEMGHFYSQTGAGFGTGFEVLDERRLGIRMEYFWSEFDRLGGVSTFGYPTSTVFRWASLNWGQLTQKSLIYWDRFEGRLRLANLYEILESSGLDDYLESNGVPRPIADDGATTHEEAIEIRLGWLENETLRDAYFANPNPGRIARWSRGDAIYLRGLPMSRPERMGPFIAQRFQRAVIQLWVEDVPGGQPPGSVTFVNGGDIFKQAGLLPRADSAQPHSPSNLPFALESEFRLVFSSQRTGSTQIYSSVSNGANAVALTSTDNVERFPAVSPDGTMLAFARGELAPPVDQRREPSAGELTLPRIVVRDLLTGDERTISPEGVWAGSLSWSPDGTRIVYSGWADSDTELYVTDVASAEKRQIAYAAVQPDHPGLVFRWHDHNLRVRSRRPISALFRKPGRKRPDPDHPQRSLRIQPGLVAFRRIHRLLKVQRVRTRHLRRQRGWFGGQESHSPPGARPLAVIHTGWSVRRLCERASLQR